MRSLLLLGLVLSIGIVVPHDVVAQARPKSELADDSVHTKSADLLGAALLIQLRCQKKPQVAQAINTMLRHRLIRYVDNENGIYGFVPTTRSKLLGLRITYISGFDSDGAFEAVPASTMVGTAPPTFLQIDVEATASELRLRALNVGLAEALPHENKRGFEVSSDGLYPAPRSRVQTSSIMCVDYGFASRR